MGMGCLEASNTVEDRNSRRLLFDDSLTTPLIPDPSFRLSEIGYLTAARPLTVSKDYLPLYNVELISVSNSFEII